MSKSDKLQYLEQKMIDEQTIDNPTKAAKAHAKDVNNMIDQLLKVHELFYTGDYAQNAKNKSIKISLSNEDDEKIIGKEDLKALISQMKEEVNTIALYTKIAKKNKKKNNNKPVYIGDTLYDFFIDNIPKFGYVENDPSKGYLIDSLPMLKTNRCVDSKVLPSLLNIYAIVNGLKDVMIDGKINKSFSRIDETMNEYFGKRKALTYYKITGTTSRGDNSSKSHKRPKYGYKPEFEKFLQPEDMNLSTFDVVRAKDDARYACIVESDDDVHSLEDKQSYFETHDRMTEDRIPFSVLKVIVSINYYSKGVDFEDEETKHNISEYISRPDVITAAAEDADVITRTSNIYSGKEN